MKRVLIVALVCLLCLSGAAYGTEAFEEGRFVTDYSIELELASETYTGIYSGQVGNKGLPNGQGTFVAEEFTYVGAWAKGHMEGYGVIIYEDGTVFVGTFASDLLHGMGTEYLAEAIAYQGEYAEGKPIVPVSEFTELSNGDKGDDVLALQNRLRDLLYLSGNQDGSYGNKTETAVSDFQKANGLKPTGIADAETQTLLYSDTAVENPDPPFDDSLYEDMNYNAIARDPDAYTGDLIKFTGKVVQVIESSDSYTEYRIATKGSYDNVIYVAYERPEGASRILEDDKVTVYGVCGGVLSYKSTMGGTITIPACVATRIDIK